MGHQSYLPKRRRPAGFAGLFVLNSVKARLSGGGGLCGRFGWSRNEDERNQPLFREGLDYRCRTIENHHLILLIAQRFTPMCDQMQELLLCRQFIQFPGHRITHRSARYQRHAVLHDITGTKATGEHVCHSLFDQIGVFAHVETVA